MDNKFICPNCGATMVTDICNLCGACKNIESEEKEASYIG